jgi:hypothetical protein
MVNTYRHVLFECNTPELIPETVECQEKRSQNSRNLANDLNVNMELYRRNNTACHGSELLVSHMLEVATVGFPNLLHEEAAVH